MEKIAINLISGSAIETPPCLDFKGVIGQEEVCNKIKFFLKTHDEETPFPTLLFTGSHGLGKTMIASRVASSLHRRFVEVNCGSIDTAEEFYAVLISKVLGDTPVTILMDEAHRMSKEITTVLLTLLNPSSNRINTLAFKDRDIAYDMSKINMILATTDAYKVFKPLLDRCERVYFNHYTNVELMKMLKFYCQDIKIDCDNDDLANACRGRGRDAYIISNHLKRYAKMVGYNAITKKGWESLKDIFGIYPMGLNRQEVELLGIIKDEQPISCANIALKMMVNEENIESEIEVRPRELGMIRSTTKGRVLTDDGKIYLKNVKV